MGKFEELKRQWKELFHQRKAGLLSEDEFHSKLNDIIKQMGDCSLEIWEGNTVMFWAKMGVPEEGMEGVTDDFKDGEEASENLAKMLREWEEEDAVKRALGKKKRKP